MQRLLNGGALSALILIATGAAAQETPLDTEEPAFETAPPSIPAPTGDATLDRLNALEAKVQALEARNRSLEDALQESTTRIQTVEVRAAKGVQANVAPTHADPGGVFTFKARGVLDVDYVHFAERAGAYDYNDGTGFRRARLGFEGTAFKDWAWRLEVDFAGNVVAVQDAYLQYNGFKPLTITLGQHKAPFGLESNNSDNFNSFLERGMFTNAFGTAGAERRIGVSVAYLKEKFTFTAGLFGDNESIGRSTGAALTAAPDESYGANARVTWEPVLDTGRIIHVGASGFWRAGLKSGDTDDGLRLSDRPNIRVDNGNIIDTGVIPNVENLYYLGVEGTAVFGPLSVTGEYGHLEIDRFAGFRDFSSDGFYVYGSWFVTGETRPFRNGNFDRIRPLNNFSNTGGTGAIELLLRYDQLDVGDTPVAARAGNDAHSYTAGANWYLTPNFKLQFNYIRFAGSNTPLDPVGAKTKGDAVATRLHIDW
ncbi:OprO/OprP family phosphate-selective porin [Glacieibacterium frigidum]|uniref:Porin n=1 Tax=Glacieibacterium frigidum TaxID=2593303 RepID=A0A552UFD2_9SPHN|nr:porin [Glacieibacterium frigidum]TRW16920.1 porin [Glacieibacterium frigidum]